MRVVIEGITGSELYLLMKILERLNFENKDKLISEWQRFLDGKDK